MTVRLPPPLPVQTVLGAIDTTAQGSAREARDAGLAAARRTLPARSGRLRQGTRGSVRRTPTGYLIIIAPTSRVRYPSGVTVREVARWVAGGTGVHGSRGRAYPPR